MKTKTPKQGTSANIDPKGIDSTSTGVITDEQKRLKTLIARRHPEYEENENHWEFLEDTYEGGREWFKSNIFRYIKEGNQEHGDRIERCYRFNHTREVVDLINKYLFKQNITRSDDAPDHVKAFWKKSTKNGLSVNDLARQISKKTSIYGRVAVVVDMTALTDKVISKADEKRIGARAYAYIVTPEHLLDYSYDDNGELQWVLIRECVRDDADPFTSSGDEDYRYRLWTKTDWKLYREEKQGRKVTVILEGEAEHELGAVPVIIADHIISDEEYEAQAMIDDIAYLDRAIANYLSNLDAIIQDQTYSQLAMPAQNVLPGEDNYTKLVEMGTKRVFLYDGEGGSQPFFLSPDPRQATLILEVVNKIIAEIYHTVGLAGERTKQDNAVGIDNSSGVAKAYDFERVNALLAAKADSLEVIENRIIELVALWNGQSLDESDRLVTYPDNFDTRGLYDEFDIASKLMLVDAPDEIRQEQMKMLVDKLFPQLTKELRKNIEDGIKDWPADPIELATQMAATNGKESDSISIKGGAAKKTAQAKPASESRQGQVTNKTK
jgi:hypothetical protein